MNGLLEGKVAIVTGGARGIGADICRVFARHGAAVVVNYSESEERAEGIVSQAKATGAKAVAIRGDVRNQAQVDALVAQTLAQFGRVDAVVNNAIAGRQSGRLDELSDADFDNMFDFNGRAVLNTVRAVRPWMKANGGGRIVNIVTELWNMAPEGWSAYMAGKGAMVGISRSLACELGPEGITVNMVAPGWMATEQVDTASEGSRNFARSLPLRRHGSGEEIGNACVFLLSDLGSYVTGAYIPVTGGRITQMGS